MNNLSKDGPTCAKLSTYSKQVIRNENVTSKVFLWS